MVLGLMADNYRLCGLVWLAERLRHMTIHSTDLKWSTAFPLLWIPDMSPVIGLLFIY